MMRASLCSVAVMALGAPKWAFFRAHRRTLQRRVQQWRGIKASNPVYPASATFSMRQRGPAPLLDAGQRAFHRPLLRLGPAGFRDGVRSWGGVLLTKGKSAT